ncbi:MAG: rhodanese-like domain-containing protein [Deltaproteobacteria bacterium]|nr:rhodanese-like domain-containing protein [Deltaproteobacteria bacterium]
MSEHPAKPDLLGRASDARTIEPELLLQKLRSDVPILLVDVRPSAERAAGTIEGARSFPLHQLKARVAELLGSRCGEVVVVSRSGRAAQAAAEILTLAGFGEVTVLEGGLDRWEALGLPLTPPQSSARPFLTSRMT